MPSAKPGTASSPFHSFADRHIGPRDHDVAEMLGEIGYPTLAALCATAVPKAIQSDRDLGLGEALSEYEALEAVNALAAKNEVRRSWIGCGYHGTITPPAIQRNILENPGWYTQYTPYQAEISQGRLESLLNFQTMVAEMTGLPVANASLLDEATGAAEAMALCNAIRNKKGGKAFLVDENCHPTTIELVKTRAKAVGVSVLVTDPDAYDGSEAICGVLLQCPGTDGIIRPFDKAIASAKSQDALVCVAADIMALALMKSPGEMGADIAIGNTQRFGVPLGFGGPHAGYFATKEEFKRQVPGRIIGVSKDSSGRMAYRLALQTREQHIRREKATSNICTAQALLANMAAMYACYHGPKGIRAIAERIHGWTATLAAGLKSSSVSMKPGSYFDTLVVSYPNQGDKKAALERADANGVNLRDFCGDFCGDSGGDSGGGLGGGSGGGSVSSDVGVSLDETTSDEDIVDLLFILTGKKHGIEDLDKLSAKTVGGMEDNVCRKTSFLTHEVFNRYHSETELMRYIKRLESRDLSLTTSMIPLGSCTMKLNAAAELLPITAPGFSQLHPYSGAAQTEGYRELFAELEGMLAKATGFDAVSLQPNSGAQGELAGLLVIKKYLENKGEGDRNICLIPSSAHGTNPASAVMAGLKVVVVKCDDHGNIDLDDLQAKCTKHKENLAALMVTYPSTHGVFEEAIREICTIVHECGGQVYMDGANLNAQLGLCRPGEFGPDVAHLNLHKTFAIPHGGGGPGVGPIAVRSHLAAYLPGHPLVETGGDQGIGLVSQAPWGSASILPISWMYVKMMGSEGLKKATQVAILNANYIAKKLEGSYEVLYRGNAGLVAHECIIDLRPLKSSAGITVDDIAKRLIDYGFHAPTVSFPVVGTVMIEPTESESKEELDRFCNAMIAIRNEINEIEKGNWDRDNNVLKGAPHTAQDVTSDAWDRPYSRELAAYGADWLREHKFWPASSRIDNAYGDRNFMCTCPSIDEYQ